MRTILVASKEKPSTQAIKVCFKDEYRVHTASDLEESIKLFQKQRYEFLFIDVEFFDANVPDGYKKQLQPFWTAFPEAELIVMCTQEKIRQAVNAVKAGASDYLIHPIDPAEVKLITDSIHRDQQVYSELRYLRKQFWRRDSFAVVRTNSPAMKEVFEKIRSVAPTESTVLLTGETGTGKGVLANLIHRHSRRSEKQFIPIHCGAIPDTLLESELFGHEKGAFTGADRRKLGKFEIAQGGTIFLDEIGTISSPMQIKLLHVLQDRMYQRVGGETVLYADVRIIVATNADLKKMSDEGAFRQDLYYRLHVFPIEIPPLRERKEDIPLLVETFLEKLNRFSLKTIRDITPEVLNALYDYHWPGNIRELENLIERAYIIEMSPILRKKSFPIELFTQKPAMDSRLINTSMTLERARRNVIEKFEREYLAELLSEHGGRINRTAAAAGIGERQLHKLMKKYGIQKEDFKFSAKK